MLETAKIYQSHMVIQREKPVTIWGRAEAGAIVQATLQGKCASSKADSQGNWKISLPCMQASTQEELDIISNEERIVYTDIDIGEVWIAGGQSNMEFWMRYEKHLSQEKKGCSNQNLRFFDVPQVAYDGQEQEFDYSRMGIWRSVSEEDIEYFSAVGYYFEKNLAQELDVPVGIIGCNWGGTSSSVWMSAKSAESTGKIWVDTYKGNMKNLDIESYWAMQKRNRQNDRGNPFADAYTELMLPRTPSAKEIEDFFAGVTEEEKEFMGLMAPQSIPGCLYEHMVKTIAPFSVRGVLWYQGENDDALNQQHLYENMLKALISDWRRLWMDEKLPFLIVRLPGWENWAGIQAQNFPVLRRCQEKVAESDENCYLCSISDAGEQFDIHPKDKKIVGERLCCLALGHIYGKEILCDPPSVRHVERNKNIIKIQFAHAEGGLHIAGDEMSAMKVISGNKNLNFQAKTNGEQLLITLSDIENEPVTVLFAQEAYYKANLYNKNNIPAIPFQIEC